MKDLERKTEIIICECGSAEHQIIFQYDKPTKGWAPQVYMSIHLTTYKNIWQRIKYAIKYVFGYKCRFGAWDEILIDKKDLYKIEGLIEYLKKDDVV